MGAFPFEAICVFMGSIFCIKVGGVIGVWPFDAHELSLTALIWVVSYGWLVVWNISYFPMSIENFIIPTDFHIFQRGGPSTNQMAMTNRAKSFGSFSTAALNSMGSMSSQEKSEGTRVCVQCCWAKW